MNEDLWPALKNLYNILGKKGISALVWLILAVIGASPLAVHQISETRVDLAPADFHIVGPDRAEVGALVRLSVKDYEPSQVVWVPNCEAQEYGLNNSQIAITKDNQSLVVVYCAIVKQGRLYLTQKTIQFGNPVSPEPESQPEPEPEPQPEPEPEHRPLSKVAEQIINVAQASNLLKADAQQIAKNFRKATKVSTTPRGLVTETFRLNEPLNIPKEVNETIKVVLTTMAENGELQTMEQHIVVWRQIAIGFEEYAK